MVGVRLANGLVEGLNDGFVVVLDFYIAGAYSTGFGYSYCYLVVVVVELNPIPNLLSYYDELGFEFIGAAL